MKTFGMTTLAAAIALSLTACGEQAPGEATESSADMSATASMPACDRECILGVADAYIAAIVAHDPSAAPLAEEVAFVENVTRLNPGEGLWETAVNGPSTFSIYVPDEENQSLGYLGMMTRLATPPAPQGSSPEERETWAATAEKSEQPVMVALRLKLADGKIVEAEHLLADIREQFMGTLQSPRPGLLAEVPEGSRMAHADLIKLGESYYDALDDNDGSLTPFAEDCERHENGMITAGGNAGAGPNNAGTGTIARDCAGQLTSKVMSYIDRIENRRVFAADPVTGLVMGLSHFRHPMDTGPYEVINMDGSTEMREMNFAPFDLPAAHIYKIGADGMMHEIEAMGFTTTYMAPTGWE